MTLDLTQNRTIGSGEILAFTDRVGVYIDDPFGATHIQLLNGGTVTVNASIVSGNVIGVHDGSNSFLPPSLFSNLAGATLKVVATGVTSAPFGAYGFYSGNGGGTNVSNAGLIDVGGSQDATGVATWKSGGFQFTNSAGGTIKVTAAGFGEGVLIYNGGAFDNHGLIQVSGATGAIGVELHTNHYHGEPEDPFINAGTIKVTDANNAYDSIGIGIIDNQTLHNGGLIEAEIAIAGLDDSEGYADHNVQAVDNTGQIHGKVLLGYGDDIVTNAGEIAGLVDLGAGNDTYDGSAGTQTGGVYGGEGADVLTGGSGIEFLFGGLGDDHLLGGGGNDTLDGGRGDDIVGGGDGADSLRGGVGADALTGGAGADNFIFAAMDGADVITDFTPGTDKLQIWGYGAWQQVQQVGADTLVRFSATDSLLLLGVQASALTAGDVVFHAGAPGDAPGQPPSLSAVGPGTLLYHDTFHVYAGETLTFSGQTSGIIQQGLRSMSADLPTGFDNAGVVHITGPGATVVRGFEVAYGSFGVQGPGLGFRNEAGGVFTLDVTFTSSAGQANGYYAPSFARPFENYGLFQVTTHGNAAAMTYGYRSFDPSTAVLNAGTFIVDASGEARAFMLENAQPFTNTGSISVTAPTRAIGVELRAGSQGSVTNSGTITVHGNSSTYVAVGVLVGQNLVGKVTIANSGTIASNYVAIDASQATSSAMQGVTLTSSGLIQGTVNLSRMADSFINSGAIEGQVNLADGNDLFDGHAGLTAVTVSGGDGADLIKGGAGADRLDGDSGDDTIQGGGGNDVITGWTGIDWLYGGAGDDEVHGDSFGYTGFTNGENHVFGGDGNDQLYGDGGSDELNGGAGDDLLTGYQGHDVAVYGGLASEASWSRNSDGSYTVHAGAEGNDTLTGIEVLRFSDRDVVLVQGAVSDFNHDGRSDVLWRNDSGEVYTWTTQSWQAGFWGESMGNPGLAWHVQDTGDYNGDGLSDILWRNNAGDIYVYKSIWGGGGFNGQTISSVDPVWAVVPQSGDFNGDGRADILFRNSATGEAYVWNSQPTGLAVNFLGQSLGGAGLDWSIKAVADFNGDGRADVLWRSDAGDVYVWNSTASGPATMTGTMTGQTISSVGNDWSILGTGDFNGDGRADVLWRHAGDGELYVWNSQLGNDVNFLGQSLGAVSLDWSVAAIGDYDGDGRADVLFRNTDGRVYLWNSNDTGPVGFTGQGLGQTATDWHILSDFHGM